MASENPQAAEVVNFDDLLERLLRPRPNAFQCQIDGAIFSIQISSNSAGNRLEAAAEMGFLPFTAESAPKRQALKTILSSLSSLPGFEFKLDDQGKIMLHSTIPLSDHQTPENNFARLILFIHQAKPYMDLVGRYL